jgi:hypothetical protein
MRFHTAILSPLLALATLVDAAQIKMNLFVSHHSMYPRQVGETELRHGIAGVFTEKLCQCKYHLKSMLKMF